MPDWEAMRSQVHTSHSSKQEDKYYRFIIYNKDYIMEYNIIPTANTHREIHLRCNVQKELLPLTEPKASASRPLKRESSYEW